MNPWRWLFRRNEMTNEQKDADLIDAQRRLTELQRKDRERRLARLDLDIQAKRRNPR